MGKALNSQSNLQTPDPTDFADGLAVRQRRTRAVWRALRHRSLGAGLVICVVLVALIASAPLLTSIDPNAQDAMATFAPPGWQHPMGTDAFGRDIFSRVLYGGQVTMLASLCIVVIGSVIGTTIGLIAGYFGGSPGFVIMRMVDLLLAFPGILLALAITAILGPGLNNGIIAIAAILIDRHGRGAEWAGGDVAGGPDGRSDEGLGADDCLCARGRGAARRPQRLSGI